MSCTSGNCNESVKENNYGRESGVQLKGININEVRPNWSLNYIDLPQGHRWVKAMLVYFSAKKVDIILSILV